LTTVVVLSAPLEELDDGVGMMAEAEADGDAATGVSLSSPQAAARTATAATATTTIVRRAYQMSFILFSSHWMMRADMGRGRSQCIPAPQVLADAPNVTLRRGVSQSPAYSAELGVERGARRRLSHSSMANSAITA
jgi:hypothetical protein